jgi:hypothetical protein
MRIDEITEQAQVYHRWMTKSIEHIADDVNSITSQRIRAEEYDDLAETAQVALKFALKQSDNKEALGVAAIVVRNAVTLLQKADISLVNFLILTVGVIRFSREPNDKQNIVFMKNANNLLPTQPNKLAKEIGLKITSYFMKKAYTEQQQKETVRISKPTRKRPTVKPHPDEDLFAEALEAVNNANRKSVYFDITKQCKKIVKQAIELYKFGDITRAQFLKVSSAAAKFANNPASPENVKTLFNLRKAYTKHEKRIVRRFGRMIELILAKVKKKLGFDRGKSLDTISSKTSARSGLKMRLFNALVIAETSVSEKHTPDLSPIN